MSVEHGCCADAASESFSAVIASFSASAASAMMLRIMVSTLPEPAFDLYLRGRKAATDREEFRGETFHLVLGFPVGFPWLF